MANKRCKSLIGLTFTNIDFFDKERIIATTG